MSLLASPALSCRNSYVGNRSYRSEPCVLCARARRTKQRTSAGLLDFLPASKPKSTPESAALVNRLVELSQGTGRGVKASKGLRAEIEEVAEQLQSFRIRNPTKSPLFWGQFEVLYCSLPIATGGPFIRGPPGRALLWDQQLRQTLDQSSSLYLNQIGFKALGLLPGEAKQEGRITSAAGINFKVTLEAPSIRLGNGAEKQQGSKQYPAERRFEVVYLDERLKIIRYLPDEADKDTVLFVQQRVQEEPAAEEATQPVEGAALMQEDEAAAELVIS